MTAEAYFGSPHPADLISTRRCRCGSERRPKPPLPCPRTPSCGWTSPGTISNKIAANSEFHSLFGPCDFRGCDSLAVADFLSDGQGVSRTVARPGNRKRGQPYRFWAPFAPTCLPTGGSGTWGGEGHVLKVKHNLTRRPPVFVLGMSEALALLPAPFFEPLPTINGVCLFGTIVNPRSQRDEADTASGCSRCKAQVSQPKWLRIRSKAVNVHGYFIHVSIVCYPHPGCEGGGLGGGRKGRHVGVAGGPLKRPPGSFKRTPGSF